MRTVASSKRSNEICALGRAAISNFGGNYGQRPKVQTNVGYRDGIYRRTRTKHDSVSKIRFWFIFQPTGPR